MEELVNKLISMKKTIASMESCTGGGFANAVTNIPGASDILKFSAVTYSNEFKEKMGVNSETILEYSVYSMEVAKEMSKKISEFANADYGIGITGKLMKPDKANMHGSDNLVFVSIYDKHNDSYHGLSIEVSKTTRSENKEFVIKLIIFELMKILNNG